MTIFTKTTSVVEYCVIRTAGGDPEFGIKGNGEVLLLDFFAIEEIKRCLTYLEMGWTRKGKPFVRHASGVKIKATSDCLEFIVKDYVLSFNLKEAKDFLEQIESIEDLTDCIKDELEVIDEGPIPTPQPVH